MKKFISLFMFLVASLVAMPPSEAQEVRKGMSKAEVYQQINEYRVNHGLPELQIQESLETSAQVFVIKHNVFYGDNIHHGEAWVRRKGGAELIADIGNPVDRWSRSERHRNILLAKGFTKMGLGKAGNKVVLRLLRS